MRTLLASVRCLELGHTETILAIRLALEDPADQATHDKASDDDSDAA